MWAMKGNWSWPGEEECTHLAGSFLCIHLGSSRSASCSDQAFIRLPAAQTQLAQYGMENRFPSPADIAKKKWKHSAMLEDAPGKKWFSTVHCQTPFCTGTGCPSISSPRKVTSYLNLGIPITNPSCPAGHSSQEARASCSHPARTTYWPGAQTSAKPTMSLQHGWEWPEGRNIIHSTLKLASEDSSLGGLVVTLLPINHRLKLPKAGSPTSVSQIRPITSSVHCPNTKMPRGSTWNFLIPLNAWALHAHTHPQMVRAQI